jgi:uncharacterized Rmd1/YagE family protein
MTAVLIRFGQPGSGLLTMSSDNFNEVEPSLRLIERDKFQARARLLGQRIEIDGLARYRQLGRMPLTIATDRQGVAVIFRYGVVVLFDAEDSVEQEFLNGLATLVKVPVEVPQTETWTIVVNPDARESVDGDRVLLSVIDVKRLQLVASALSKSVVLDEFEAIVKDSFERIEPLAANFRRFGRVTQDSRILLEHVGQALLAQHQMAGHAGISDKPDLLWYAPELDGLHLQLEDQLEISQRHSILSRKLDLINNTAMTALSLLNTRRGHRLEWYIVILIVVEIMLSLYDLFAAS